MKILSECELVSGGNAFVAAFVAVDVFTSFKEMQDAMQTYNEWGHQLGEWAFDMTHEAYDPNRNDDHNSR